MAEGEFALVRNHLGKAADGPTDPVRWGSAMSDLDFHAACADAAAQDRDLAALETYAPLAAEESLRLGHRLYQGIAHRAQGVQHQLADNREASLEHFHRATMIFEELGTRWQLGLTQAAMAESHRAAERPTEARQSYRAALAAFEALGAKPAAAQVRAALENLPA